MRLPAAALLMMAAARAQELEQVRLEFLVDHLQETMADAWDVTGTVAELVEASVPDHQADLVGGAEALRKAIFAALRMLADVKREILGITNPRNPRHFGSFGGRRNRVSST